MDTPSIQVILPCTFLVELIWGTGERVMVGHTRARIQGDRGYGPPPLENHKLYGFL